MGKTLEKMNGRITVKSIIGIVLLLVVFSAFVGAVGFTSFTDALMAQYADGAFRTAETASIFVDADRIDEYLESGGTSEEYLSVLTRMSRICNYSGSTFIYVIQPDLTDYAHITFLFSTINKNSNYTVYDFGYVRETTNNDYREKYRALYEGKVEQALVVRDKGYIETDPHITAMVPLKNSDGQTCAILCVQRQMDILVNARNSYLNKILIALTALVVLVITGQSLYLNRVLIQPVKQISEEATRFAEENVTREEKLLDRIRNRDEIGLLAGSIDRMEEQIQRYVEDLTKITAEKERIHTELSLATRIQASMLPHTFPAFPDRTEFDLYAMMDPAKEVGGDFYDYFLIDDNHLGIVMADVSGKGIPAALFMMASMISLRSFAHLGTSASETLARTNDAICSNNQEEMFLTVWFGILEISTGKLTAANAGHEYPALMRADGRFELLKDKHCFVIGAMEQMQYKEYELQLEPGTKLFLYTDGVPEATAAGDVMFGTDRMLEALNKAPDAAPEQLLRNVREAVDDFVKDAEQFDDLTMLCFEYRGKAEYAG